MDKTNQETEKKRKKTNLTHEEKAIPGALEKLAPHETPVVNPSDVYKILRLMMTVI